MCDHRPKPLLAFGLSLVGDGRVAEALEAFAALDSHSTEPSQAPVSCHGCVSDTPLVAMIQDPKRTNQRRQHLPYRISRNAFHRGREVMVAGPWSHYLHPVPPLGSTSWRFHNLNRAT